MEDIKWFSEAIVTGEVPECTVYDLKNDLFIFTPLYGDVGETRKPRSLSVDGPNAKKNLLAEKPNHVKVALLLCANSI